MQNFKKSRKDPQIIILDTMEQKAGVVSIGYLTDVFESKSIGINKLEESIVNLEKSNIIERDSDNVKFNSKHVMEIKENNSYKDFIDDSNLEVSL